MSEALTRRFFTAFDAGERAGFVVDCLGDEVGHNIDRSKRWYDHPAFRIRAEQAARRNREASPDGVDLGRVVIGQPHAFPHMISCVQHILWVTPSTAHDNRPAELAKIVSDG